MLIELSERDFFQWKFLAVWYTFIILHDTRSLPEKSLWYMETTHVASHCAVYMCVALNVYMYITKFIIIIIMAQLNLSQKIRFQ